MDSGNSDGVRIWLGPVHSSEESTYPIPQQFAQHCFHLGHIHCLLIRQSVSSDRR